MQKETPAERLQETPARYCTKSFLPRSAYVYIRLRATTSCEAFPLPEMVHGSVGILFPLIIITRLAGGAIHSIRVELPPSHPATNRTAEVGRGRIDRK